MLPQEAASPSESVIHSRAPEGPVIHSFADWVNRTIPGCQCCGHALSGALFDKEEDMTAVMAKRKRDERGMTTAEYAVGTVATVSIVGALIGFVNNEAFRKILEGIIRAIVDVIIALITGAG